MESTDRNWFELDDEIELLYRRCGGIDVRLLWLPGAEEVTLVVTDDGTGQAFAVAVPRAQALDAFYHPFLFAPTPAAALV